MWETQVQSLGQEYPLEKEMATHSSTLAWKIPWTEDPGRLQYMGSQELDTTEQLHFSWLIHSLVAQMVSIYPQCRDLGSIPGLGRSPGEGHGNTPQ